MLASRRPINVTSEPERLAPSVVPTTVGEVAISPGVARALKRLADQAQDAIDKRDTAIIEAKKAGATLRELEAATGINHVTVMRMIEKRERVQSGDT